MGEKEACVCPKHSSFDGILTKLVVCGVPFTATLCMSPRMLTLFCEVLRERLLSLFFISEKNSRCDRKEGLFPSVSSRRIMISILGQDLEWL